MAKLRITHWLVTLLIGCFSSLAVSAADLPPLTEKEVKLWISSAEALDAWSSQHEERIEQFDTADQDEKATVEDLLKPVRAAGLAKEADKVVREQGFKSLEHWAEVALKIVNASLSLAVEQYSGKPDNSAPAADKKLIKQYEQELNAASKRVDQAREAREAAKEETMSEEESLEGSEE